MRLISVISALLVGFGNLGVAQAPSSADLRDLQLARAAVELATLAKEGAQDARSLAEMARPFMGSCELFHTVMEISEQASDASSLTSSTLDLLNMYLAISTTQERAAAGIVLSNHIAESRQSLESAIKIVNLSMGPPSLPTGAAVLGVRVNDHIRSVIELFDKLRVR